MSELYDGIEAMTTLKLMELNELVMKMNNSKTRVAKNYYWKKVKPLRDTCIKYLNQLHALDPDRAQKIYDPIETLPNLTNSEENSE